MGLSVKCGRGMRLRLGADTFIYVDRAARLLVEGPGSMTVRREYVVSEQGAADDPREANYLTLDEQKERKAKARKEIASGRDPQPG